MVNYCCVSGCKGKVGDGKRLSFHKFPRDGKLKKEWCIKLKMGKKPTETMVVCSQHFKEEDFKPHRLHNYPEIKPRFYLKPQAIPTANLPKSSHETPKTAQKLSAERQSRLDARSMASQSKQKATEDVTFFDAHEGRQQKQDAVPDSGQEFDSDQTEVIMAIHQHDGNLLPDSEHVTEADEVCEMIASEALLMLTGGEPEFSANPVKETQISVSDFRCQCRGSSKDQNQCVADTNAIPQEIRFEIIPKIEQEESSQLASTSSLQTLPDFKDAGAASLNIKKEPIDYTEYNQEEFSSEPLPSGESSTFKVSETLPIKIKMEPLDYPDDDNPECILPDFL